jgi:carbonic anhydrase
MVIACADSRVDPSTVFNARPGELFVVRNVAAIVPPYEKGNGYHGTSAAIEFAVQSLNVSHIVVMGHGQCGGVAASLRAHEKSLGEFIAPWVGLLNDVRDELLEHARSHDQAFLQHALELMAVKQSIDNLTTFAFVKRALQTGSLALHGAWFSIAEGQLHWLDQDTGEFKAVAADS